MIKDRIQDFDYFIIQESESNQAYCDICFDKNYAKLYETKENGQAETFILKSQHGCVEHTYIKRKIPTLINGKQYFDITTAYGYGGPITSEVKNLSYLLKDYYYAFHLYCYKHNIVSEFIRFHLFENIEVRTNFYGEVGEIGPHISRDLKKKLDIDIHKSVRKSIRKAEKSGLSWSYDTTEKGMDDFINLYHSTMDRRKAKEFYYFDQEFFKHLHDNLKGQFVYTNAILDGKVISSFLTLFGEKYAYAFLGGTLKDYFKYEASTYLEYQTMEWLKDRGLHYYTIGGGYDGKDGIFNYKKKFDKEGTYPFFVGKKIHDKKVYDKLIEIGMLKAGFDPDSSFFPLYRM